jgi:hypothetical protein
LRAQQRIQSSGFVLCALEFEQAQFTVNIVFGVIQIGGLLRFSGDGVTFRRYHHYNSPGNSDAHRSTGQRQDWISSRRFVKGKVSPKTSFNPGLSSWRENGGYSWLKVISSYRNVFLLFTVGEHRSSGMGASIWRRDRILTLTQLTRVLKIFARISFEFIAADQGAVTVLVFKHIVDSFLVLIPFFPVTPVFAG